MSAISEAKALEMIDGRVLDMMAYDYKSELKDYIASNEEITHKDVLIKVLPLVKDNIELQREQYG